jgi:anti-sigma factor RsiW
MSTREHERYEILLVRAVDEVISTEERRELDAHIEQCSSCREELEDFVRIKETTDAMTARIMADFTIEPPREPSSARAVLSIGFLLLLLGALVLLGFAGYTLFTDADVPLVVKLGTGGLGLGTLVLLAYVLKVRARAHKRDPYKEIDL